MGYKRKYEQSKKEEEININNDARLFQRSFLEFLSNENLSFFEKRNNKKYMEKKELYSNLNEAKNNPKIDSKGRTYYEISYENIFGFVSTKTFKSLEELEAYQNGVRKDIESLERKEISTISAKNFKKSLKKFYTSGKCPDYSDGEYSKEAIINGFNNSLDQLKKLVNDKSERDFFNESQLSPILLNALKSINSFTPQEKNDVCNINLSEKEILDGKVNSLNPDELEVELFEKQDDFFGYKTVKINPEIQVVRDRNNRMVDMVTVPSRFNKESAKKSIQNLIETNELIDRMPWYKKIFGNKHTELKNKLNSAYDSLEVLGLNKDFVIAYVNASPEERSKYEGVLDEQIDEAVNKRSNMKNKVEEYVDKAEKVELEKAIKNDFKKLKEKESKREEIVIPDEIFANDILINEKEEVESNDNFIEQDSLDLNEEEIEELNQDIKDL